MKTKELLTKAPVAVQPLLGAPVFGHHPAPLAVLP